MSTNHTSNYNLNQWVKSDKVLMEDFNADNAKIDAALGTLAASVSGKASVSALNSLSQTVAGHSSALTRAGNGQVYAATYTGDGQHGSGVTSITFPHKPMVVFVGGTDGRAAAFFRGQSLTVCGAYPIGMDTLRADWNGNTLSWSGGNSAAGQLNADGFIYTVVALLMLE